MLRKFLFHRGIRVFFFVTLFVVALWIPLTLDIVELPNRPSQSLFSILRETKFTKQHLIQFQQDVGKFARLPEEGRVAGGGGSDATEEGRKRRKEKKLPGENKYLLISSGAECESLGSAILTAAAKVQGMEITVMEELGSEELIIDALPTEIVARGISRWRGHRTNASFVESVFDHRGKFTHIVHLVCDHPRKDTSAFQKHFQSSLISTSVVTTAAIRSFSNAIVLGLMGVEQDLPISIANAAAEEEVASVHREFDVKRLAIHVNRDGDLARFGKEFVRRIILPAWQDSSFRLLTYELGVPVPNSGKEVVSGGLSVENSKSNDKQEKKSSFFSFLPFFSSLSPSANNDANSKLLVTRASSAMGLAVILRAAESGRFSLRDGDKEPRIIATDKESATLLETLLKKKYQDSSSHRVKFIRGDLSDKQFAQSLISEHGPFTDIVHIAVDSNISPWLSHFVRKRVYEEVAVETAVLLDALSSFAMKNTEKTSNPYFVLVSSVEADSSFSNAFHSPRGIALRAAEQAVALLGSKIKLPFLIVRTHDAFGPHDRTGDIFGNVVDRFVHFAYKNNAPLPLCNGGQQKRSFSYAGDLAEDILAAMNHGMKGGPFTIGGASPMSVAELADAVERAVGRVNAQNQGSATATIERAIEKEPENGMNLQSGICQKRKLRWRRRHLVNVVPSNGPFYRELDRLEKDEKQADTENGQSLALTATNLADDFVTRRTTDIVDALVTVVEAFREQTRKEILDPEYFKHFDFDYGIEKQWGDFRGMGPEEFWGEFVFDAFERSAPHTVSAASPETTDRVAVLVLHAFDPMLPMTVKNVMYSLGEKWALRIYLPQPLIPLLPRVLPLPVNTSVYPLDNVGFLDLGYSDYSQLLLSAAFWNSFEEHQEHILIFQLDSLMIKRDPLDRFLSYAAVGALWRQWCNEPWCRHGGNGGFSLRRKSVMNSILLADKTGRGNEDAFVASNIHKLHELNFTMPAKPPIDAALSFCTEGPFWRQEKPVAIHQLHTGMFSGVGMYHLLSDVRFGESDEGYNP